MVDLSLECRYPGDVLNLRSIVLFRWSIALSAVIAPLVGPVSSEARAAGFEGCGPTADLARAELAKNIASTIYTRFQDNSVLQGEQESLSLRSETTISSALDLRDTTMTSKTSPDGSTTFCAGQTREQLEKSFLTAFERARVNCVPVDASDSDTEKEERIVKCRQDSSTVDVLFPLFYDRSRIAAVRAIWRARAALEAEAARIVTQSLTFTVQPNVDKGVVFVDHTPHALGKPIPLTAGVIRYEIQAPGYCPIRGRVDLRPGRLGAKNNRRVAKELDDYTFPVIVFQSDAPNAALEVDGEARKLNQSLTIDRCYGPLPYKVTIPVIGRIETVAETIELEPGLKTTESIVVPDRQYLAKLAESWKTRPLLQFRYGGGVPLSGDIGADWVQTVQLEYMWAYHPIRYGVGVGYGYGGSSSHLFDAYFKAVAQLASLGDTPLHLGSRTALIPFVGLELGIGYHGLRPRSTNKRGDFGSIGESLFIVRSVFGTSLTLSEDFSLVAEGHWEFFTHEQRLGVSVGLGLMF